MLLALFSCQKEVDFVPKDYPFIILNEVTSLTSSGAEISATWYGESESSYSEYGLVIAQHESPTISDRIITLKDEVATDFTIKLAHDLTEGRTYYVRTFIRYSEKLIYSNEVSFQSAGCLPPEITNLSADSATSGEIINIIGNNFSEVPLHNMVYFRDVEATVLKSSIDTITVFCPNIFSDQTVKVEVTVANQTTESSQNFKLLNPWKRLDDFPGKPSLYNGVFQYKNYGYLHLGASIETLTAEETNQLWQFDFNTYSWTASPNFSPQERRSGVGFTIGDDSFCGLGFDFSSVKLRDLWKWDHQTNLWTQMSDYPGVQSFPYYPLFVVNNKMYLLSYFTTNDYEFWEYNPGTDSWAQLNVPDEFLGTTFTKGFTYNNEGYFIQMDEEYGDTGFILWKYNSSSKSFQKLNRIPTYGRISYDAFVMNDNLYIPTNAGYLFQYNLVDQTSFYLNDPTFYYDFNFVFTYEGKTIVGFSQTKEVYEFYPRK